MVLALYVLCGVLGGSTASALAYRLVHGMPLVADRSRCPSCHGIIRARDNVPLVSYLLLRGRCRACRARIPWRYPLLELGLGGLGGVVFLLHAGVLVSLAVLVAMVAAVVAALVDLETYRIPNRVTYPTAGVILGLELGRAVASHELGDLTVPVVIATTVVCAFLALGVVSRGGMGMGDAKLAGVLALALAALRPVAVLWMLLASFAAGALVGIGLVLAHRRAMRSRLPFGPFLAIGGGVALILVTLTH